MSGDAPSLERCIPFTVYFYSFYTYVTSFSHFTLHLLRIYIARAENLLIPDDTVDRRKLGFWILLVLNSSLRPHLNSYIFFNHAAEAGQHEQISDC